MTDFTGAGHSALDYDLAKMVDTNQAPAVRLTPVRSVLEKQTVLDRELMSFWRCYD